MNNLHDNLREATNIDALLVQLSANPYFDMLSLELPTNKAGILESLENDKMIVRT